MKREFRYKLYFCPEFPIDDLHWRRDERDKALLEFIDTITAHIREFGLENPPTVYRRKGRFDVRPGKCRVTAYQRLGHTTIPAVIADFDTGPPLAGWEPLPYDRDAVQALYSGDCVVELDHRFFNVKKNVDVVNRPGVENKFAKELREHGAI